ncbi:hypothetical protein HYV50_04985 [Candidatus Pacearchaeota archaeon]|nr:hypothetical protein [Candidatus Pacearchaeota archaeon]
MIKISQGKIKLDNVLLDLSTFGVRPKVTEKDLETYYDSFVDHIEEAGDYFEDRNSFNRAVKDSADEKRPKLVPREPKYPFMWRFRTSFMPFDFLRPTKRRLHDKYFLAAHCVTKISNKKIVVKENHKPLDEKLQEDIEEKFKQYPEYEGIIEIPNDRTQPETKSITFHEALHYVIFRYRAETGRNFVNTFIKEDLPELEKYQAEHAMHERVVEILTDKLLTHDPDAQFETRWLHYSINDGVKYLAMGASAIAMGILLGTSITRPYLLPLALVPGRIRDYTIKKYKQSKRDEILKPSEYPNFKI